MAPTLLFDISHVDMDKTRFDAKHIESVNPHRGAMRLLDGIIWQSEDYKHTVAYKDVRDDEFWVPGHIPGSPVFPGVLMIETAAQLASFVCLIRLPDEAFMGFAGVDKVKFRGQVVPGDRLVLLCEETEFRRRRCVCNTQGFVNGNLVFEAVITGMPMEVKASV
ncbi:3-hydroxyacyl-ACP dehydratase FabZ family protein [Phycisphaerales bacterium AB-hyl4]|uniref:3-hydroxyacyl-ACP dehydratase FabZ family protein n=1 Tax=Natronomicrosphaera hydrolytica TaxID=3242702 RepID=A0ABV4U1K7_9BACT